MSIYEQTKSLLSQFFGQSNSTIEEIAEMVQTNPSLYMPMSIILISVGINDVYSLRLLLQLLDSAPHLHSYAIKLANIPNRMLSVQNMYEILETTREEQFDRLKELLDSEKIEFSNIAYMLKYNQQQIDKIIKVHRVFPWANYKELEVIVRQIPSEYIDNFLSYFDNDIDLAYRFLSDKDFDAKYLFKLRDKYPLSLSEAIENTEILSGADRSSIINNSIMRGIDSLSFDNFKKLFGKIGEDEEEIFSRRQNISYLLDIINLLPQVDVEKIIDDFADITDDEILITLAQLIKKLPELSYEQLLNFRTLSQNNI